MAKFEKKTGVLFVRVTPALLKKLDAKVAKSKGEKSRGDVTREALYQHLSGGGYQAAK